MMLDIPLPDDADGAAGDLTQSVFLVLALALIVGRFLGLLEERRRHRPRRRLVVGLLAALRHVLAARLALGLVGIARDVDRDRHLDFRMQRDRHRVQADRLDRRCSAIWLRVDREAAVGRAASAMSRAETEPNSWPISDAWRTTMKLLPSSLAATLSASPFSSRLLRLELRLHALELGAVVLGGAQRLALRQQEIARKAVLDAHDFAHLAELGDAFEQDHFHLGLSVVRIGFRAID